jgi:integral membrane protein
LVAYRLAAYVTGVMLLVLVTEVILHWVVKDPRYHWLAWSPPLHGFLYLGYLATTVLLGTSMRWQPGRMVLVALAGTIPMMSFVAERSVTGEVRKQLAAGPR